MRYTFGDAKRILVGTAHSKAVDIGLKINDAIRALCGANAWEHEFLRQVVRIFSAGPVFSLPQGSAGLVRACVNGSPVSLRGQDFQFLSSGPGDLSHPGPAYRMLSAQDIEDLGTSPVWCQPPAPVRLAATHSGPNPQPPVTVHCTKADGTKATLRLDASRTEPVYDDLVEVVSVDSVVLDPSTDGYVSLHATDADTGLASVVIGRYHPLFHVPEFRCYRVNRPMHHGPFDILAEVQMEPLPLVDDDDVMPFPSLEPVKCMLLYQWNFQNNETAAAEKYLGQAMQWIGRFNSSKNAVQTPVVTNVQYNGSMGELSNWCVNL